MKVFMLKDVEHVGMAGQVAKVTDGYAANFLIPQKLAIKVDPAGEAFFANRAQKVVVDKEVFSNKMSMLAEHLKNMYLVIAKRVHDDGKLYGSVSAEEIVELLQKKDVTISKKQVVFNKTVRAIGEHKVAIKLSAKLTPEVTLKVVGEEK